MRTPLLARSPGYAPKAVSLVPARPRALGVVARRLGLLLGLGLALAAAEPAGCRHLPAQVEAAADVLPAGKRAPLDWRTGLLDGRSEVHLSWPGMATDHAPIRLRLTVGLDAMGTRQVEAKLARSGRRLGVFDIRFPSAFGLFEIPLQPADAAELRGEGATLALITGEPVRIITGGGDCPPELAPHLLIPGERTSREEFLARMGSLASLQPFGWMEGCVLDGILDLAERPGHAGLRQAADRHIACFVHDGRLVYEGPTGGVADGRIYGIEGLLPFAALARRDGQDPLGELAVQFWRRRANPEGAVIDGNHTTSEGSYTVGYPLAVIGRSRRDDALERGALAQLRYRQARLFDGAAFWRTCGGNGVKGERNWARGIAWQLLGQVRTLGVLQDRNDIAEDIAAFRALAEFAVRLQRGDGLWSVFADDRTLTPDTAGSAGIAAAFALGHARGWLGPGYRESAGRTLAALERQLTPDGFLGGASQSNKGGPGLQRGEYRVIYQMGMGLMAQLMAAQAAEARTGGFSSGNDDPGTRRAP